MLTNNTFWLLSLTTLFCFNVCMSTNKLGNIIHDQLQP